MALPLIWQGFFCACPEMVYMNNFNPLEHYLPIRKEASLIKLPIRKEASLK